MEGKFIEGGASQWNTFLFTMYKALTIWLILCSTGQRGYTNEVILIGFPSVHYDCYDYWDRFPKMVQSSMPPTLSWFKREIPKERLSSEMYHRNQNGRKIELSPCISPTTMTDRNPVIREIIKDIVNNDTILALANNSSQLLCIAVSIQFTPVTKWKSAFPNVPDLRINTFVEPSDTTGCDNQYKTISVLDVDPTPKAFQCTVDKFETCLVRNYCGYRRLINPKIEEIKIADHPNVSNFKCQFVRSGICSNFSFNRAKLTVSFKEVLEFEKSIGTLNGFIPKDDLERLCYLFDPFCIDELNPEAGLIPLCKEDCYVIQLRYPGIWSNLAKRLPYFHWNGCGQFPSILDPGQSCQQPLQKPFLKEESSKDCYVKEDRHYVGMVNRTEKGYFCQRWDVLCPHYHDYWPDLYPELVNAENYCRNPGGRRRAPWCFTTSANVKWAFCTSIPLCSLEYEPIDGPIQRSNGAFLLIGIIGSTLLLLFPIIIYQWKKKRKNKKTLRGSLSVRYNATSEESSDCLIIGTSRSSSMSTEHNPILDLPPNELYYRIERGFDRRLEHLEIPRRNWTMVRKLASSEHNDVFLARFQSIATEIDPNQCLMVVKSLKSPYQSCVLENFLNEACTVATCDHRRVVRLLGVSLVGHPASMLFEYMSIGDLKSLLEVEATQKELNEIDHYRHAWDPPLRHMKRLLDIAYQIADGMVYLSNQRIVHRDLAARNILVDERLQMKISDFGLSKFVDKIGGVFMAYERENLPVRWTAPEAWSTQCFSSKSDVWSYGVLVWEILSFGMQPYFGMNHQEVVHMVMVERRTLSAPHNPSLSEWQEIERVSEELMKPCFAYNPEDRLEFIILLSNAARLRAIFEK